MKSFVSNFVIKLRHLFTSACFKVLYLQKYIWSLLVCFYRLCLASPVNPIWFQLGYFVSISGVGFFSLRSLKPKAGSIRPTDVDLFFMSVSAVTVSSMSTVEMEVFSDAQLIFMVVLILLGGQVFTSLISLHFRRSQVRMLNENNKVEMMHFKLSLSKSEERREDHNIELGLVPISKLEEENSASKVLSYVVLGYLIGSVAGGYILVTTYLILVPNARSVLEKKDIKLETFSVFAAVSTFSNCGFIPTNENMIVFKSNPGLLLILIPQALLGNTLYPSCLRFVIWVFGRVTRRDEFEYLLKYTREMRYRHLLPAQHSLLLVFTAFGLIVIQFVSFCGMEWNSVAFSGMSSYEKTVGALFQTVNTRHAGESVLDLSIISPALSVLFALMMYLPSYTTFFPMEEYEKSSKKGKRKRRSVIDNLVFSKLSYLVIFVILICITEGKKMKEDPLNFSLWNIIVEVVSAYSNVGLTNGYSCKRRINTNNDHCKDAWYGFAGRWSNSGKLILILVMFFGRLKKSNSGGGRAWILK